MKKSKATSGDFARATLTIHRADEVDPERRRELAAWLRRQATDLVKDGSNYAPRFTARFLEG